MMDFFTWDKNIKRRLFTIILIFFFVVGCTTIGKLVKSSDRVIELKRLRITITVPKWVSDFAEWDGTERCLKVSSDGKRHLHIWEANNPQNKMHSILVTSIFRPYTEERYSIFLISVAFPSKGEERQKRFCIDSSFLNTGIPSFKFIEVKEAPTLETVNKLLEKDLK